MDPQTELPMDVNDKFWICSDIKSSEHVNVGKWMLFYDKKYLNERWLLALKLFNKGDLGDVICLKCSTAMENSRASTKSGIIIFYCNFSEDKQKILDIGCIIVSRMKYNGKKIYYKTDHQTTLGTQSTGQQKNYLYSLDISDDICRTLPSKKEMLKYPIRYNDSFFENLEKFKNSKKMENYTKWKKGVNFKTNKKIKIGGDLYEKLKSSFQIKYFIDEHVYKVFFNEVEFLDIENYQKDTKIIIDELNCENNKIKAYNITIDDLEDKILKLEKYEDFVLFDGIKYGKNIPNTKGYIVLPKDEFQKFHSKMMKKNVEKEYGKDTKHCSICGDIDDLIHISNRYFCEFCFKIQTDDSFWK